MRSSALCKALPLYFLLLGQFVSKQRKYGQLLIMIQRNQFITQV